MSEGLNRVFLLGNLGADPELRTDVGGSALLKLSLATTETYLDREGNRRDRTDWHRVAIWGKRAEALRSILSKGRCIMVEGRLQTRSWDAPDGSKRYATEVVARDIRLVGRRPDGAPAALGGTPAPAPRADRLDDQESDEPDAPGETTAAPALRPNRFDSAQEGTPARQAAA